MRHVTMGNNEAKQTCSLFIDDSQYTPVYLQYHVYRPINKDECINTRTLNFPTSSFNTLTLFYTKLANNR
jgi:hypothetical protein